MPDTIWNTLLTLFYLVGVIISLLIVRELKFREAKGFTRDHIASPWQSQPSLSVPVSLFLCSQSLHRVRILKSFQERLPFHLLPTQLSVWREFHGSLGSINIPSTPSTSMRCFLVMSTNILTEYLQNFNFSDH